MPAAVLLDTPSIDAHVRRLASEITRDHPDGVLLIGVLKGALIFLADLARAITDIPVDIDFISISRFAPDTGRVKILQDLTTDISGRDCVLVEDIVDTGLTLAYLLTQLGAREPRRLTTCTLLDRPERRIVPQHVRYRGVELAGEYVLGYGLHVHDLYRNVPFIVTADRDEIAAQPDVYVGELYGREVHGAGGSVTVGRTEDSPPEEP